MLENTDELLSGVCTPARGVNPSTLKEVLLLGLEIAREGREQRKIGTMFVIGDESHVLKRSGPLILDPLWFHPEEKKRITDPDLRGTIKELAQLDGAFVVSDSGIVLSACRFVDTTSEGLCQPMGLGSRHMAGASITLHTDAVAVVVSRSGVVRLYDNGEVVAEIIADATVLSGHSSGITGEYRIERGGFLTIVSKRP